MRITCPLDEIDGFRGCGSTNVSGPDDEGLYDCRNCGLWFQARQGLEVSPNLVDRLAQALKPPVV